MTTDRDTFLQYYRWLGNDINKDHSANLWEHIPTTDWHALIEHANKQALSGYIYYKLSEQELLSSLPEQLNTSLKSTHQQTTARNVRLIATLQKVGTALAEKDIRLIILKGMYLIERVYPSVGVRSMVDIDFLIRREDAATVRQLLLEQGYTDGLWNVSEVRQPYSNQIHFTSASSGIEIEPHFDFFPIHTNSRFDIDEIWQNSTPFAGYDNNCLTLAEDDHLLYMCHHAISKHLAVRAKHVLDIHLLVGKLEHDFNWQSLLQKAEQYNVKRSLLLAFSLLKYLFDRDPVDVIKQEMVKYRRLDRLTYWLAGNILDDRAVNFREYDSVFHMYRAYRRGCLGEYLQRRNVRLNDLQDATINLPKSSVGVFRVFYTVSRYAGLLIKMLFNSKIRQFMRMQLFLSK
ncbi:nucleotidyltransferase family protein [Calditrichota bacterium]